MNLKLIPKLFFIALVAIFLSSCSGNDDTPEAQQLTCTEFTTPVTVNGDDNYTVLFAQIFILGDETETTYSFQVSGVDSNCLNVAFLQIGIDVDNGITGTFPIMDFFDADLNEAHGTWVTQNLSNGTSQGAIDIESGTVSIADNGNNNFTIDFSGTLLGGQQVSFSTTHTF